MSPRTSLTDIALTISRSLRTYDFPADSGLDCSKGVTVADYARPLHGDVPVSLRIPAAGARNDEARVTARERNCGLPVSSSGSLLAASGRLGGAALGRHNVVKFVKRNPTKCSRSGDMSVLGCALRRFTTTYDYCRLGLDGKGDVQRLPRRSARTAKTKRSPCWHSSSFLRDTIGRLGGAASGRHHVSNKINEAKPNKMQ